MGLKSSSITLEDRANGEIVVLRHVVLLRWKPGTSESDLQLVRDGLAALPAAIPEILHYAFGEDAGLTEGNFDFAIVADFESQLDYHAYATHDAHQKVILERIRPVLEERAAAQYEF
jgi:hypothetical protein